MTTETYQLDALAPYSEVRAKIQTLKAENTGLTFDYETPKGNKAARSHVASLRTIKGDIERRRKALKADALEFGRKVDAVAKELTGEIEAMIDVHQGPLDLIESREQARVAKHRNAIETLHGLGGCTPLSSATCAKLIGQLKATVIDDTWEEFKAEAIAARDSSLALLEPLYDLLVKQEAEAAELARLREEKAKREAEDRAKQEAEARAKREEEIRAQAEAKAKREAADAALAEARRKEAEAQAAINAEREKTRKAELEAEKARREQAEAEARAAHEEHEKRKAEAKRAADKEHREKVLSEIALAIGQIALSGYAPTANGRLIAEAIAAGKIPHVKIEF